MPILMCKSPFTDWAQEVYPGKVLVIHPIQELSQLEFNSTSSSSLKSINERLEFFRPVLLRHVPKKRISVVKELLCSVIYSLLTHVDFDQVKVAIFETAATHHIDNIVLEVICDMRKINKIFLSHTSFTSGLLPMEQGLQIDSRKPLPTGIFEDYSNEVDLATDGANWRTRISMSGEDETRFLRFVFKLLKKSIVETYVKSKRKMSANSKNEYYSVDDYVARVFGYSFIDELRLGLAQKLAVEYYNWLSRTRGMKRRIREAGKSTFTKIIIYAHYQPEVSSFPLGHPFENQIVLVKKIKKLFPNSLVIYKEHPHISRLLVGGTPTRVGISRSPRYYHKLNRLGCIFLSKNKDDEIQILNSKLTIPVTLTGKIAIENALQERKSIIFGNPWFAGCPNIVRYQHDNLEQLITELPEDSQLVKKWIKELLGSNLIYTPPWSHIQSLEQSDASLRYSYDLMKLINFLENRPLIS